MKIENRGSSFVHVDAGGTAYTTTSDTLVATGSRVLRHLAENPQDFPATARGRFVDCDGDAFAHILNYGRDAVVPEGLSEYDANLLAQQCSLLGAPELASRAEAAALEARALHPGGSWLAVLHDACAAFKQGRLTLAKTCVNYVLERDSRHAAWYAQALVNCAHVRPQTADASAYALYGCLEENCAGAEAPDALTAFRKAVVLAPDNPAYRVLLAQEYLELGQAQLALDCCEAALALVPEFQEALDCRKRVTDYLRFHGIEL